jgi:diguanylate cyclase (GGDEF)-like protein
MIDMIKSAVAKRILIVDDDFTVRLLARTTLEQYGFIVEEASDGIQAVEQFGKSKPDLILLDVMMEGMDGFDVCKTIREHPDDTNTSILMMTGLDDSESIRHAYEAGATDFITKPVNWTILGHRAGFMMNAKRADDQIRYLAMYDALTGLPNRVLLKDRLEQAIQLAARHEKLFAVLFIDLDLFKDVNDIHGHNAGDAVLQAVSKRILSTTRGSDTLARLGGDEFVILIQDIQSYEDVDIVAHQVLDHFSRPFQADSHEIFLSATIGIAIYPFDGKVSGDLIKNADTAMNYAKKLGKNCYQFFSIEMQTRIMDRLAMQNKLRKALEESRELFLNYQPRVDSTTGITIGMEVLVRWLHPEDGVVSPEVFIPLAEESGLIVPLGEWVLFEACKQAMEWQKMGYAPLKISVNFSPVQFKRSNVFETVRRILAETGLAPCYLEIEITESTLMQLEVSIIDGDTDNNSRVRPSSCSFLTHKGSQTLAEILNSLRSMGITIAMDDFGTGYSSLSYLNYFPIDVLKIDRSFISRMDETKGSPIITAIIAMAEKLGLRVVAEGVETTTQKNILIEYGCHELQGYLLGRPVDKIEFERLLSAAAVKPFTSNVSRVEIQVIGQSG